MDRDNIPQNKRHAKQLADLELQEQLRLEQEVWHAKKAELIAEGQKLSHPDCAEAQTLEALSLIAPDIEHNRSVATQLIALQTKIKDLLEERKVLFAEEMVIEEMNKKHAVVRTDGQTSYMTIKRDGKSFTYESKDSFKNYYEASLVTLPTGKRASKADIWIKNPLRREYEEVVFIPTTDPAELKALESQRKFNIFRGLAVSPLYGTDRKLKFWDHVKDNICSGNEKYYEYMRNWLAMVFQRPQETHTAIIIIGKQGTGKTFLVEVIGRLLGKHHIALPDLSGLTDKFDFNLINAILVSVSEAEWGARDKSAMAKIKSRITDKEQTFEPKGRDRLTVRNYMHLILCSNSGCPIPLASDDRRFFVTEVAPHKRGKRDYFKAIMHELEHKKGFEILLADLLTEKLDEFDPNDIPHSSIKLSVKVAGFDSVTKFILEVLQEGYFDPASDDPQIMYEKYISKAKLYQHYENWHSATRQPQRLVERELFTRGLIKAIPSTTSIKKRYGGPQIRIYALPSVEAARKEFSEEISTAYEELFPSDTSSSSQETMTQTEIPTNESEDHEDE